jgi:hypothetical protein
VSKVFSAFLVSSVVKFLLCVSDIYGTKRENACLNRGGERKY